MKDRILGILRRYLVAEYPYRILDPVDNPTGMGVISKYPIWESGDSLPLNWVGVPQVLTLDWGGQEVSGLGHTYPGGYVRERDPEGSGRWSGPRWVVRIDYIFHSDQWETVEARLVSSNGVSDHRAVIAELMLKEHSVQGELARRP